MPDIIIDSLTPEQYEEASSKFAAVGAHLSECQLPGWETAGKSIKFPFKIIEEGADKGKQNKIVAGLSPDAVWKFKEMETALGLQLMINVDGKMTIPEDRLLECVGKQFQSVWTPERDTRPFSEGGTGRILPKATGALPVGVKYEAPASPGDELPF